MTPRIFISYRTSDGADKATALARELNAVFGQAQVFLDKEDLTAGQPWRDATPTSNAVSKFAAKPSVGFIGVTFLANVSVTRSPATRQPTPIAVATIA